MAKEPDSRPITVEDLIARTVPGSDHFPRADSVAVNREAADGETASAPGASGMPGYTKPAAKPAARVIGASGMPAYTPAPSTEADTSPNVVTGIIPVVTDDELDVDTGSLRAIDPEDLIGVELPATAADLPSAVVVAATELPAVTVTTSDPGTVIDDDDSFTDFDRETTAALVDTGDAAAAGDHLASTSELAAATDSALLADESEAVADPDAAEKPDRSPLWGWLALAGEVVLGLAIGAGLFWGFTILWKQYVYLALVLAVVVIFAIVTFAYVLRKRDLPTTLLALAVGLIVTIGPLVLLV